mgnify:CR=1 FL=1
MRRWFPAVLLVLSLFSIARATIITSNEYGIESTPHGDIRVVPAWRWTLEKTTQ